MRAVAAGYRAHLELAVGSEGRTNVREPCSPLPSPSPSIHSSSASLDRQGKRRRAPRAFEVWLLVTRAQRDQGLVRAQVTGALSLSQLIQLALEGKGLRYAQNGVESKTRVRSLGWDPAWKEGTATHSSILAWRIPWTDPGDLPDPGIKPRSPALQADSLPAEPPGQPGSINTVSGSSAFSKTSLNIWKFTVHILLKPGLENFEHYPPGGGAKELARM